jgi:ParB-like chromosome segregation protein Spo0J
MLIRTPPKASTVGQVTRPVADIEVGQRYRHDLGDVQRLAQSIAENGLLHPIPIKPDNTLIAGARRLSAVKLLGWAKVPVTVVNISNIVRGALTENAERKNFLPSEIDAIRCAIEPPEQAAAKQRGRAGLKRGQQRPVVENFHDGGKTRDKIAKLTGISGRTLDKIRAVVNAAEQEPERFGALVSEMDRTRKVDRVYAELRRVQVDEAEALPIQGDRPSAEVVHGDFREHGHIINDTSVDLIFTDLPYAREYVPLYGDLAQYAARVLVDGGSLVTYVGHIALPEVLALMTPHLRYHWICASVHGSRRCLPGRTKGLYIGWKPLLWFTKGPQRRSGQIIHDCIKSTPGNKIVDHPWAQGLPEAMAFVRDLSRKGSLVVDPCLGGGTTGVAAVKLERRFVGFEIDGETAVKAEARIIRAGGRS